MSFIQSLPYDGEWSLFLDRDGVINDNTDQPWTTSIAEFRWLPGAREAIATLSQYYQHIVIVTNQRAVSLGLITEPGLQQLHAWMVEEIEALGGRIDGVYYCPHGKMDGCECRKPAPDMAFQAKRDHPEIDFGNSVIVGDSLRDLQMGDLVGMTTVWIGPDEAEAPGKPDFRFESLHAFAKNH